MNLSENFTIAEFEKSIWAIRRKIPNRMTPKHRANAVLLAQNVLQPARDELGPILITSGYRNSLVNSGVRGSRTSDHMTGRSADLEALAASNWDLLRWIYKNCEFDQLIAEWMVKGDASAGWVHVSYRATGNRRQVFGFNNDGAFKIDAGLLA